MGRDHVTQGVTDSCRGCGVDTAWWCRHCCGTWCFWCVWQHSCPAEERG